MANLILEQLLDANTETWTDTQQNGCCYSYSVQSDGTIVRIAGGRSCRIEIRGEDDNTTCTGDAYSTKHRAQIRWINTAVTNAINLFGAGTGHWMGFSIYIPADFPVTQGTAYDMDPLLFQFNAGPTGPEFHCVINSDGRTIDISSLPGEIGGTARDDLNTKITNNKPIVLGGWNDFVIFRLRQRVGDTTPGRDIIWLNGEIIGNHTGPNAKDYEALGAVNNFTTGIYWSSALYPPSSTYGAFVIYIDQMRIALAQENEILSDGTGTQAGFALVDPTQGTTNYPPPSIPSRYTIVDNDLNPSAYSESSPWSPASNNIAYYPSPGGTERYTAGELQDGGHAVITASFSCGTWSAGNASVAFYVRNKTDRSSGVRYTITVGGSVVKTGTNWSQNGSINEWFYVPTFYQAGGAAVITISNEGSDAWVAADAVAYYVESGGGVGATGKICSLKNYVSFTGGTVEPTLFDSLHGGTSGASAEIRRVVLESGAWDGSGAGKIYIGDVTSGPFQSEAGTDDHSGSLTISGAETANYQTTTGTTTAASQEKTISVPIGGQSGDYYLFWVVSRKDNFNNGNIDATNDAVGNETCEEVSTGESDDSDHISYLIPYSDITDPVSGTLSVTFVEDASPYAMGCTILINIDGTTPYDIRDGAHSNGGGTYHDRQSDTGSGVDIPALTTGNDNVALITISTCISTSSDTCSAVATDDGSIDEVLFSDVSGTAPVPWIYADIRTVATASTAVGTPTHTYTDANSTADGGVQRFTLNRAITSSSTLTAASYTAASKPKSSAAYEYDPIGDGYVTDGTSPYILEAVAPTNGTAYITTNNTLVAQPNAGFDGNFTIDYTVSDATLPAQQSTGTITIPITNTPPTGQDETVTVLDVSGNTDFPISTLTNADSDGDTYIIVIDTTTDASGHLTASAVDSGATLRINNDGSASAGDNIGITFYYDDQSNTTSASAIYNLTVKVISTAGVPTGSSPVAISCYRNEDTVPVNVITLGAVTDSNGQPLTITAVNGNACVSGGSTVTTTYGEIYNTNEVLYYSPLNTLDLFGPTVIDSLTVTISNGTNTVDITTNISVLAANIGSLLELTGDLSLI